MPQSAAGPGAPRGGYAPVDHNAAGNEIGVDEVMYSINSFLAVMKPVAVTMLLASLVVVHLSPEESGASGGGLQVYTVYDDAESTAANDGEAVQIGKSLVNALLIVACSLPRRSRSVLYKFRWGCSGAQML